MKTPQGLLSYLPAKQPAHAVQLLVRSAQPLISSSLLTWNAATLGHPCRVASVKHSATDVFCARPFREPHRQPRCARPPRSTASDTDADRMLAGV